MANEAAERCTFESTPSLGVEDHTTTITMRDGTPSDIRTFRLPDALTQGSALIVLIFGGGFTLGTNLQLSPFARALTATYGATVVTLSYRLAPEHKFPVPSNDVWDSLVWITENAESLGADPSSGFVVGGGSAGANLAAVSTHIAALKPLRYAITGLWLSFPVLMSEKHVPDKYRDLWLSRAQCTHSPVLDADDLGKVEALYAPDEDSPAWSPFNSPGSFCSSKLPRAFIQVAGLDPLRDDALIYAKVLQEHGVETQLEVYPGVSHGFIAFPALKQSRKFNAHLLNGVGWMLGKAAKSM